MCVRLLLGLIRSFKARTLTDAAREERSKSFPLETAGLQGDSQGAYGDAPPVGDRAQGSRTTREVRSEARGVAGGEKS